MTEQQGKCPQCKGGMVKPWRSELLDMTFCSSRCASMWWTEHKNV